jgi:electron transfer flavoprotein beta subunit
MGKQAVDGDNNQVGQVLAELLGWPQGCFASKVELEDTKVKVTREVDGGFDHVELDLPAVVTADLRLNEPRYASLPGIMKAKRKPIKEIELGSMGVDTAPKVIWHGFVEPPARKAGIMVPDVPTLVTKLRDEAKAF